MLNYDAYTLNDLIWDDFNKQYRFPSNRVVSKKQLFQLLDKERSRTASKLDDGITQLIDQKISFEDWQRQTTTILRDAHVKMMRIGRGGKDKTAAIHYLDVANELRRNQYPRLRQFASDIQSGKLSEKQIRSRMKQYALSTKVSYEKGLLSVSIDKGQYWGRRRLGNCRDHCQDCINYAIAGWMPLSEVTPPGVNCVCGGRCCCSVETRRYPPMTFKSHLSFQ